MDVPGESSHTKPDVEDWYNSNLNLEPRSIWVESFAPASMN